jgi:mRNA-degrading endonuclease RelE of RelBE toxin-antitoxin system
VATACVEFIFDALARDSHRVGGPLRIPFEGQCRARRGAYLVRYRIDEGTRTVDVLDVEASRPTLEELLERRRARWRVRYVPCSAERPQK